MNIYKTQLNTFILSSLLALFLPEPLVAAQTLATKIDTLIEQTLPQATVGVFMKDATTGQVLYSRNADKLLSPASSTKLFTAAAALYQLSPAYHYVTTLSQKGDDVYLTFQGAPDFTIENFKHLLAELKKAGLKTISGNIVLDISRFKPPYYAAGTSYDDLGWFYSPPETALILNENAVAYDFISAKKLGLPVQIKPKTSDQALTIINQVITVDKEQEKDHCSLSIKIKPENTLQLFGCLAQNEQPVTMKLAIPQPVLLAKSLIQDSLRENNILLKGQIITGQSPKDAKLIASMPSANLVQLLNHMLKDSDNLYANSLSRTLGFVITGEGSSKQGAFALKQVLAKHTTLDMAQLQIADGMGTRYNLATAKQIVTLLSDLYQDKSLQAIMLASLPQSGVSGSLANRLKQEKLAKIVFAKTGTMHDISSLSGYWLRKNAHPIIFSIIINGIHTPISEAKSLEEQILGAVVTST